MFAVFYKNIELGEVVHTFKTFLYNKDTDIFITKAIQKTKWNKDNLKVFVFNEVLFDKFMQWQDSYNETQKLFVDQNGLISKIKITSPRTYLMGTLEFSHPQAVNFYSEAEMTAYNHNQPIQEQWEIDNPNADETTPLPNFLGVEWPETNSFNGVVNSEEVLDVVETLQGVLVDIDAKIIEESGV